MPLICDSETFPIDRALAAPPPVCWQWCHTDDPEGTCRVELIEGAFEFIVDWLEGDEVGVFATGAYDMACLCARYPSLLKAVFAKYKRGQIRDIQIDQKLIDIAYGKVQDSYSVAALCERYGLEVDKDPEVRTGFAAHIAEHGRVTGKFLKYARLDVIQPAHIWHQIQAQERKWIAKMGSPILHVGAAKARAAWFLQLQSCWGVHTNPERVRAFTRETERKIEKLGRRLKRAKFPVRYPNPKKWGKKHNGHVLGPNGEYTGGFLRPDGSADRLVATSYITELSLRRGFELKLSEKTGEPSCDADSSAASGSAVLEALCAYGSADKLMSRCENLAEGFVYPLQCRYTALLETGRTSCSAGKLPGGKGWPTPLRGTQLQNPGKSGLERGCYEPPYPDWLFFDADFPSAELHSLGQVQIAWFGRSKLGELLNEGRDILLWFGATVLNGIPYEAALARKKAGDRAIKGMRQLAKAVIYGLPGGLGAAKLVTYARVNYGVIITEKQARAYKQIWLDALPEMVWYFERINKVMGGRETGFLRHPVSDFWRGGAFYCALCNSPFQSLTAFAATDAGFYVAEEMYTVEDSPLYGTRGIAFIHDQIIATGHESVVSDAADRLAEVMETRFNVWHPDVPIKPGKTEGAVMRWWSKDAEPIRNKETGKLEPWPKAA